MFKNKQMVKEAKIFLASDFSLKEIAKLVNRHLYLKVRCTGGYTGALLSYLYMIDRKNIELYPDITLGVNNFIFRNPAKENATLKAKFSDSSNIVKLSKNNYVYYSIASPVTGGKDENKKSSSVTIYFFGKDRYKERRRCLKQAQWHIYKEYLNKKSAIRITSFVDPKAKIKRTKSIRAKTKDDIIFDKMDELISKLDNWGSIKQFYEDHNITYKLGILLYGPAGTGKTSLVNFIAAYTGRTIQVIDLSMSLSVLKEVIDEIEDWSEGTKKSSILVFEELDTVRTSVDSKEISSEVRQNAEDKIQFLLQLFDGFYSLDGIICVATTNNYELLDPRLIRKGRFDITYDCPAFNYDQAQQLCNKLGTSMEGLGFRRDEETRYIPVAIQSACIDMLRTNAIQNMLENSES